MCSFKIVTDYIEFLWYHGILFEIRLPKKFSARSVSNLNEINIMVVKSEILLRQLIEIACEYTYREP